MDLHGQRVVILGDTSGIGLARRGHRHLPAAGQRRPALAELPLGTGARAADLTDPALVCRLFGDLGDIDHLVFTAGELLALMNRPPWTWTKPGSSSPCVQQPLVTWP
jgi:NAD(P)-dependent dehydrogenase (short-subunit alcohol dehydrogenase family)